MTRFFLTCTTFYHTLSTSSGTEAPAATVSGDHVGILMGREYNQSFFFEKFDLVSILAESSREIVNDLFRFAQNGAHKKQVP
mmetsp:Transcript_20479/g.43364  ORF Transcript_20479/g.43364 Transcript_20479/m.43364 type:complete len:82 (+) Transcript_20479:104-349(+)